MTFKDYQNKVKQEVYALNKIITPEQRANLNEDRFDPNHGEECIYGQLCGNYSNPTARSLKSAVSAEMFDTMESDSRILELILAGKNKPEFGNGVTTLESYILRRYNDGKCILRFLQGKRKTLRFDGKIDEKDLLGYNEEL